MKAPSKTWAQLLKSLILAWKNSGSLSTISRHSSRGSEYNYSQFRGHFFDHRGLLRPTLWVANIRKLMQILG